MDCLLLLLVADVLQRVVEEVVGGHVTLILPHRAQLPRPLEHLPAALNILPATIRRTSLTRRDAPSGQPARVTLVSTDRPRPAEPANDETLLPVGGVLPRGVEHDLVQRLVGRDPLTARLALLRFSPSSTAILSAARLHRAGETLDRWRFKVASWKDAPPASAGDLDPLLGPLANGCDTATVLRLMHRIETDHGIPSGAKYEVFVHLDRVLGLDLTRRQFGPNVW
ncbi:MAG: hypothetical protein ABI112_14550 [Terracoccus sp.]